MLEITYFKVMDNHKIMDNYGGCTGQLDLKSKFTVNLQTLTIELKMALIPNGGKSTNKRCRSEGTGGGSINRLQM